jgi:hypothetical protein
MVTAQSANEVFLALRDDPLNQACVDCGSSDTFFASITYGCFLCPSCAESHQKLGKDVSFVKSLSAETWSVKQLRLMTCGGNSELLGFMELFSMPTLAPAIYKYSTQAAKFYRDRLICVAEGGVCKEALPSQAEGLALYRTMTEQSPISGLLSSAFNSMKTVGNAVATKAQQIRQNPKLKQWEEHVMRTMDASGTAPRKLPESTMEQMKHEPRHRTAAEEEEYCIQPYESYAIDPQVMQVAECARQKLAEIDQMMKHEASDVYSKHNLNPLRPDTPPQYR